MCEFQTYKGEIPYCEYTESACTLCAIGNKETYNKAIKKIMRRVIYETFFKSVICWIG